VAQSQTGAPVGPVRYTRTAEQTTKPYQQKFRQTVQNGTGRLRAVNAIPGIGVLFLDNSPRPIGVLVRRIHGPHCVVLYSYDGSCLLG
jgi:hypothetical protein